MYSAYKTIQPHFDMLARVGYYKIVMKDLSPLRRKFHGLFRIFIWFIVFLYNLQHIIRVVEMRYSTMQVVNTLFILLTTLNTLGKQLAFNLKSRRIDVIIDVINGPMFIPSKDYHVQKMKENGLTMHRLLKLYIGGVSICGLLWGVFPLVNRALGEEVHFTGYFPFDTSLSPIFELCVAYMNIVITIQGYGNVTMDCTIVALYAQAKVQFQILRYNLENIIQSGDKQNIAMNKVGGLYIDDSSSAGKEVKKRFVNCILHHRKILWFIKEIMSIFAEAMVFQFFVTAWVICLTVYKIVGLSLLSAEFFSMAMYLFSMLAQFFIYCYYGTRLKYESEFVNQSIYSSDWLSLSPKFRKQLLLMMEYCKHPVVLLTAYIVPITLESYIAVLKASYTLFTFLDRK